MSTPIFKKSVTNFYLLLLLSILSIASIVFDKKYPSSNNIRVAVNDYLFNPIQFIIKTPSSFINTLVMERKTIDDMKIEINKLKKENIKIKANLQRIDVLENEVTRLRSIKAVAIKKIKNIKIAEVIQRDVIPNKKSLKMNIGSKDNINMGQTVMGINGLIGQVVEINSFTSKVLLITDSSSNVPAIVARTGQQVIVKGKSQTNMMEIAFLKNEADVQKGDLIVTSGQAKRFIPSIKIGRVKDIVKNEGERFSRVTLMPLENINNINEVIVTSDENENE
ncbi:MAG: rod shape-determining protein MreC [Gammaproteobacteria bacterium]|nr:rod shape-determining protein MreC [Gammaproteobacteria bacterium]MBL6899063.1 rod shape-determining protein MreC [Gammaproteobacteria bacterium]